MAKANAQVAMVPLTADHRERFQRDAPAQLALRGTGWFAEQAWASAEPALAALVSIVGMYAFGWPAAAVFAFSLASLWNGVACDFAKILFARVAVFQSADQHNETRTFWAVADAIRAGGESMRADALTKYHPGMGMFIDLVFGGVATVVMLANLSGGMQEVLHALADTEGTRLALAAMLGTQWLATIATIVRHRRPVPHAPMRFAAGLRGPALFVLMFVGIAVEGGLSVVTIVLAMNVGLLLLAALSAWGVTLLRRETDWLRAELERPPRR